jgi:hypothetical protein
MLIIFSTPVLIRHLQPKTVFFLDWCLLCSVLASISCLSMLTLLTQLDLNLASMVKCQTVSWHLADTVGPVLSVSNDYFMPTLKSSGICCWVNTDNIFIK